MRDEVEDFEKQVDMFLERFTASLDLVGTFIYPKSRCELNLS